MSAREPVQGGHAVQAPLLAQEERRSLRAGAFLEKQQQQQPPATRTLKPGARAAPAPQRGRFSRLTAPPRRLQGRAARLRGGEGRDGTGRPRRRYRHRGPTCESGGGAGSSRPLGLSPSRPSGAPRDSRPLLARGRAAPLAGSMARSSSRRRAAPRPPPFEPQPPSRRPPRSAAPRRRVCGGRKREEAGVSFPPRRALAAASGLCRGRALR